MASVQAKNRFQWLRVKRTLGMELNRTYSLRTSSLSRVQAAVQVKQTYQPAEIWAEVVYNPLMEAAWLVEMSQPFDLVSPTRAVKVLQLRKPIEGINKHSIQLQAGGTKITLSHHQGFHIPIVRHMVSDFLIKHNQWSHKAEMLVILTILEVIVAQQNAKLQSILQQKYYNNLHLFHNPTITKGCAYCKQIRIL